MTTADEPLVGSAMEKALAEVTGTRTYEVVTAEGRLQFTIPEDWKITYGPVSPAKGGYGTMALRVYESETKQRAIFTNVVSFRDLSIPVARLAIRERGGTWKADDGRLPVSSSARIERRWVREEDIDIVTHEVIEKEDAF